MAIIVNIILFLLNTNSVDLFSEDHHLIGFVELLPWLVNGLFIILGFMILPQFALGYLIAIAISFAAALILMVVFVAACIAILAPLIGIPLVVLVFGVLIWLGRIIYNKYSH